MLVIHTFFVLISKQTHISLHFFQHILKIIQAVLCSPVEKLIENTKE